jgi:dCTP diphosphatase
LTALALVGEVGELAEIFQWRRDEGCEPGLPKFSEEDKVHVGEEMSDVLL